MATEVSICSNALRRLGDDPITSLTDDTESAEIGRQLHLRRSARIAELKQHY